MRLTSATTSHTLLHYLTRPRGSVYSLKRSSSLLLRCVSTTDAQNRIETQPAALSGAEIREKFLRFYEDRQHRRLPSSSLIPEDPTVLITIAGMLQFKPIFLGQSPVEFPRVTTTQKCVRTNDIENVGETARHHTFFEMLGNFSFGDYFKKAAIKWAWELSTEEYGLPASRIWISVYEDDQEALELWKEFVPENRILKMGEQDNFWKTGTTGPCGPCSELYYDFHPERGPQDADLNDDSRFIEFYNLVFMEMDRAADGTLTELKSKNIDTGLGLERMAQILQKVPNNYETDLLFPIVQKSAELASLEYQNCSEDQKRDLKVMADHTRAVTYLTSDGVVPSNLGRGYVLRRLIRRIIMKGYLLGIKGSFISKLCQEAVDLSPGCDPNVFQQKERILLILSQEEEQFSKTLISGEKKLSEFIKEAQEKDTVITGKQAFMLFDTYGFPLELTEEISKSKNLQVDVVGFEEEMASQKERSKSARQDVNLLVEDEDVWTALKNLPGTSFLGYQTLNSAGTVLALIQNGRSVDEISCGEESKPVEFEMVLDQSPFYAESGGQIADQGTVQVLSSNPGTQMSVLDVQNRSNTDLTLHRMRLASGVVRVKEKVNSEVDGSLRKHIMCHHTATHLLQSAIKQVLGSEVGQQGSLVSNDRLRFDFNSPKALTQKQISKIEQLVNKWIVESRPLSTKIMDLEEAKKAGAIAMFGEKYSQQVRVVNVSGVSMELCGGTHVSNTSELLAFKVVSESAIQSGIRRIEAVAGPAAIERFFQLSDLANQLRTTLKVDFDQIPQQIQELQKEVLTASRDVELLQKKIATLKAENLLQDVETIQDCKLLVGELSGVDGKALQTAAGHLMEMLSDPAAVVLGSAAEDRVAFSVAFSPGLVKLKLHAGKFVSTVASICGGRGGGRPNLAQAGAKDPEKFTEALQFAEQELKAKLTAL